MTPAGGNSLNHSQLNRVAALAAVCENTCRDHLKNLLVFLALVLSLVATEGCERQGEHKNVCPIDGQPSEWSKQRDPQTCEHVIRGKTQSDNADGDAALYQTHKRFL
jgi:hypothetical protein